MKRRVGEVMKMFNPEKYEGVLTVHKVYGNIRGEGDGFIKPFSQLIEQESSRERLLKLYRSHAPFLDLRDPLEISRQFLRRAVPIDYHDIVSGAVLPILPLDLTSTLVVFSRTYRGQNAAQALHKYGYDHVLWADYKTIKDFDDAVEERQTVSIVDHSISAH